MRLRFAVPLFALLLASLAARAACVGPDVFVVDVEVRSCTAKDTFTAATRACLLPWMRDWHDQMTKSEQGVIVEGTIRRMMDVTTYDANAATLGGSGAADEDGQWFVKDDANVSCETTNAGTVVRLLLNKRCCDTIPPSGFACWYGMDTLGALPPAVAKALEWSGSRVSAP